MSTSVKYQVMPPLSPDEYQELHDDIAHRGVVEPIHVDEGGVVIDGHHRKRIADELGIECPKIVHDDLDDAGKRSLAFTLNLKRRHLNREQRRALIAESLQADPGLSNREHARRTGASNSTVGIIRKEMEADGQVCESHTSRGADGKVYPASQPSRPEPEPELPQATALPQSDLDELNAEPPTWQPAGHLRDTDLNTMKTHKLQGQSREAREYVNPSEHITKLMQHVRAAQKNIDAAITEARYIDGWKGGEVSLTLRDKLNELDEILKHGGFDTELARLIEEENR